VAEVFKRKLSRYVLDGEWVEVGRGKHRRRVLRGGQRVSKDTPGAQLFEWESAEWYGRVGGRYVKLSPDRAVAEKLLRKKLHDLEDLKVNRFAKHQQTELAEHIEAFRENLESQARSPRYIRETIGRLKIVTANCTRLEHVTAAKLSKVLNDLAKQGRGTLKKKKRGAGPATRNSYLAAAKGFCQWCVDDRRLPDNPLAHLKKLNEQVDIRVERRTLSQQELALMIAAADESREIVRELSGPDRAMLYALAIGSGLRASEIASLTVGSLQLDEDPPIVIVEAAHSKRRQREEQPIPTWLAERLRTWLANRPRPATLPADAGMLFADELAEVLWPGSWRRHAAEMLRNDLASAKIDYRDAAGRTFDFHALRHQYISDLAAAGVHPKIAQSLARHSDINLTLKRYTHVGLHDQVGAVEQLSEPKPVDQQRQKATGTHDARPSGEHQVSRRIVTRAKNLPLSPKLTADREPCKNGEKARSRNDLRSIDKAEGTGVEPATGFPAPHFQCGR